MESPKNRWNEDDDELVLELVSKLGKDWGAIAYHFRKKSSKQIRER